ncbi:MAG: mannitol dehydrogenase family protein [Treponema sp.]|jgi:fructuronate reductase|nr:mannitol dehydrogenase family protein [Treponema sp.]
MRLNDRELSDRKAWEKAGIELPRFDREKMNRATRDNPQWVHFGAGNIFRAFPAAVQQALLEEGCTAAGIIAAEGYDYEIIDALFAPHDNLSLLVTLKADGSTEKKVIASISQALKADCNDKDFACLEAVFRNPGLQMASFTITEKGYSLTSGSGAFIPEVEEDFINGPAAPVSYMGKAAALMHRRYLAGELPIALVSMDNCSHNGDKLREAITAFAAKWLENGRADKGFVTYLENPSKVSFPWTMIDKITPRPDETVMSMLAAAGFECGAGRVTAKGTYIAPFVNAEETQYLVIEDSFPNGRPPLEKGGVIFTDRETVDKVEKMKVCTCLNPLHTALAVFGCLLGYNRISEEMKNPDLVRLVEIIGLKEGLPVVVDPKIIQPGRFIDEVIKVRLPNPFMPDTPQRIATDSSQKIPVRFGETIKAYLSSSSLKTGDLKLIPLVLAAWVRYLMGIDDEGKTFTVSPDPLYSSLTPLLKEIKLGDKGPFREILKPILSNERIFAVDLYEAGLGERVERYFEELLAGPGAAARVLKKYLY